MSKSISLEFGIDILILYAKRLFESIDRFFEFDWMNLEDYLK